MVFLIVTILLLSFGVLMVPSTVLSIGIGQGHSMEPYLHAGDVDIGLRVHNDSNIQVGTIIEYYADWYGNGSMMLIQHRVVGKGSDNQGQYFICRGDNNTINDPQLVRAQQIMSVYLLSLPLPAFVLSIVLMLFLVISATVLVNSQYGREIHSHLETEGQVVKTKT